MLLNVIEGCLWGVFVVFNALLVYYCGRIGAFGIKFVCLFLTKRALCVLKTNVGSLQCFWWFGGSDNGLTTLSKCLFIRIIFDAVKYANTEANNRKPLYPYRDKKPFR